MGSVSLDWQLGERFSQQITWTHMGRHYTDPANTNEYPGHDLIHWHGQFDLNEDLTLFFRVHNLTDEAYAERADFVSVASATCWATAIVLYWVPI